MEETATRSTGWRSTHLYRGRSDMHQQELLKGNTEALLEIEPMYGYQMAKEVDRRSSGYFAFKEGTLYPALHRLERDKLVEGNWMDTPNGVRRRYYSIAAKGKERCRPGRWSGDGSRKP